jgi:hypothetical protein
MKAVACEVPIFRDADVHVRGEAYFEIFSR